MNMKGGSTSHHKNKVMDSKSNHYPLSQSPPTITHLGIGAKD